MAIIQCPNKHYYDNVKFSECPHCRDLRQDKDTQKTVAKYPSSAPSSNSDEIKTMSLKSSLKNDHDNDTGTKTIAKYVTDRNMNPIAGWLVCIDGENKGRSFEIHIGKNFVGRSMKMDIHTNDEKISRENHYSIIFEPNKCEFFIMQGNGITYINDELLSNAVMLKENDKIEAGSSTYRFVPYCKEGRDWND